MVTRAPDAEGRRLRDGVDVAGSRSVKKGRGSMKKEGRGLPCATRGSCCSWFSETSARYARRSYVSRLAGCGWRRAGGGRRGAGNTRKERGRAALFFRRANEAAREHRGGQTTNRKVVCCLVYRRARKAHGALRYRISGRSIRWAAGWRRGGERTQRCASSVLAYARGPNRKFPREPPHHLTRLHRRVVRLVGAAWRRE